MSLCRTSTPLLLLPLLLSLVAMATAQFDCLEGEVSDDQCRASPNAAVCNGRGQCVCGECACHERLNRGEIVFGQYCECDNFSCDRHNGNLCGGDDRGACECGRCRCRPGWRGEACECADSQDACIEPGSDRVCSGRGSCVCGACKCNDNEEGGYSGKYCQDCPTCRGRCFELRPCVECKVFVSGEFMHNCTSSCSSLMISQTDLPHEMGQDDYLCSFMLSDPTPLCRYKFFYSADSNAVHVPPSQPCLRGADPTSAPGGAAGGVRGFDVLAVVTIVVAVLIEGGLWFIS